MSLRMLGPQSTRRTRFPTVALATCIAFGCTSTRAGGLESGTRSSNNTALEASRTSTLQGAWRLVETAVRATGQAWDVRPAAQGGLFVFSARHYSYFYLRGAQQRPRFADANRPTEAERSATYDTFIAGAGSYTFDGRTAALRADFRKNPNEMTGELWRWEAEAVGDTLRFVFVKPPFLPDQDWRLTLVRVE